MKPFPFNYILGALAFAIFLALPLITKTDKQALFHNVIECTIYNMNGGIVWQHPGRHCAFRNNGDFITAIDNKVIYFNSKLEPIWQKDLYSHHQINIQADEILILSEEFKEHPSVPKKTVRYDTLHVFDFQGNQKKTFRIYDSRETWYDKDHSRLWDIPNPRKNLEGASNLEFSHFNSFYRVPANPAAKRDPAFQAGNYVISDLKGEIFILDSELKNKLWSTQEVGGYPIRPHDAQITPFGDLIFYFNNVWKHRRYTTLDSINLLTNERRVLFKDSPPELFFAWLKGGIQLLPNGNYLTNDTSFPPRGFEINPVTMQEVWSFYPPDMDKIQQIKRYNLKGFLAYNQGI